MGRLSARAMRLAILSGALCGVLQGLPDQALKAQLLDLAAMCETEADAMVEEMEFDEEESPSIRAA